MWLTFRDASTIGGYRIICHILPIPIPWKWQKLGHATWIKEWDKEPVAIGPFVIGKQIFS
jgi:hypothetical protein